MPQGEEQTVDGFLNSIYPEFHEVKSSSAILQRQIKKTHALVTSGHSLGPLEQKILLLMLSAMSCDDSPQTKYTFKSNVLTKIFSCSATNLYPTLKPVGRRLITRTHSVLNDDNRSFTHLTLFAEVTYANGELILIPSSRALPVIFDYAKKGFALVDPEVYSLKGRYNIQLYCLLSRFKSPQHDWPAFDINELKFIMGVTDINGEPLPKKKTMIKPSVFIDRVIRKSLLEINESPSIKNILLHTDPDSNEIGFKLVKTGERISKVIFLYSWPKQTEIQVKKDSETALDIIEHLSQKRLSRKRLTDTEIEQLAAAYKEIGQNEACETILAALAKRQKNVRSEPEVRAELLLDESNWKDVEF